VPEGGRPRRRPGAGAWALAAASVVLSLAAAEAVLRMLPLTSVQRIRWQQQAQAGQIEVHPRGLYRLDPATGWTLAPGFSGRLHRPDFDIRLEVNRDGLRDRTFGARTPGTRRIFGLGDSFAFGWGVENEESLFKVLERRLNEGGGGRYEVVNAGIPGFGTYEELQLLRSVGLRYEPDLVVVAFYEGNDYQNNGEAPRRRVIEDGYLRDAPRGGGLGRALVRRSVVAGLVDAAVGGLARKRHFRSDVEKTKALLSDMKSLLDASHIPLLLVFIPDQDPDVYGRPRVLRAYDRLATGLTMGEARDELRAHCAARGIAYCALSGRFEEASLSPELRLKDTHFSPRGHEAAADEVAACVRDLVGLGAGVNEVRR